MIMMHSSGIVESYGTFIPIFLMAISIYIPSNSAREFSFLHTLSSIYC